MQHSETYLNNAQSSWRYRIWEVTSWWRDTEQKDIEGKVNQSHWHTLIWTYDHTGPWYTNKKGQHHISNGLQILTVMSGSISTQVCDINYSYISNWLTISRYHFSQFSARLSVQFGLSNLSQLEWIQDVCWYGSLKHSSKDFMQNTPF